MRYYSLALMLLAFILGLTHAEEPPPAAAAKGTPGLSDEKKQENESRQVVLELQVIEVNKTKIRNLGFDLDNFLKWNVNSPDKNGTGFVQALARNNLARVISEPRLVTLDGTVASLIIGRGYESPTVLQLDCLPTALASGKFRLAVRYEVSRIAGEDFSLQMRAGESTLGAESNAFAFLAGDSITRTKPNGGQEEIGLVFLIKPYLSKR
jgi:Flp pilus assembly secretin CpaC